MWHEIPHDWPTDSTTYWIRTWWFVEPFQALWVESADDSFWAIANPHTSVYSAIPWFLAPFYRDL